MIKRLGIAAGFSLLYMTMYPVLIGGLAIYHYPYVSPLLAAAYVLGGILLQAWFCLVRRGPTRQPSAVWHQVVTGIVYAAAVSVFPGGIYQS